MRILFITATRIGDAVISTGVLHHLTEKFPGAHITVACGPLASSLFAAVPGLQKVIVLEKKPMGKHWFSLWQDARKTDWDLIVDLRRSLISYLVSTQKRKRLGPDDRTSHRVALISQLFDLDPPADPKIWISETHREQADAVITDGSPVVAFAPFAARPEKTWPAHYFHKLGDQLAAHDGVFPNCRFLILGAEDERTELEHFSAHFRSRDRIKLIGCPDLLTVAAVLSKVSIVVANDSGVAHLAAAMGCPTVALFGPTSPDLYQPWGPNVAVALAPDHNGIRSMEALSVSEALAAIETVLKKQS